MIKRIFAGVGLVLGGKAGAGILSLAYLFVATRYLGPTQYGVLVLVHGYVTTVNGIVEFPTTRAILRYGAEASRDDDSHRLARLLRHGAKIELIGGLVAIVVAMLLAPVVAPHLGWPTRIEPLVLVYCFAVVGSIRSTPASFLQLIGRFDLIGLHNLVQPIVRLLGTMFVIAFGLGIKSFLTAWLVAAIMEFATMWALGIWFAWKRLGPALLRPEDGSPRLENPGLWRFLIGSNADTTLSELAGRAAPLVVGWLMSPAMAGLFAVAQRAVVVIAQPAQILGQTAYAELAHMVASGERGAMLRRTLAKVVAIALVAACPIVLAVLIIPEKIVFILAGEAFLGAAPVMAILVVARAIALIGPPCSAAISALGHPLQSLVANLIPSLGFLAMLPWLLGQYGLAGAGYQAMGQALVAGCALVLLVWYDTRRA